MMKNSEKHHGRPHSYQAGGPSTKITAKQNTFCSTRYIYSKTCFQFQLFFLNFASCIGRAVLPVISLSVDVIFIKSNFSTIACMCSIGIVTLILSDPWLCQDLNDKPMTTAVTS